MIETWQYQISSVRHEHVADDVNFSSTRRLRLCIKDLHKNFNVCDFFPSPSRPTSIRKSHNNEL